MRGKGHELFSNKKNTQIIKWRLGIDGKVENYDPFSHRKILSFIKRMLFKKEHVHVTMVTKRSSEVRWNEHCSLWSRRSCISIICYAII